MGLTYGDAGLAAIALTRMAAEESARERDLTARMFGFIADLVEHDGADAIAELAIALARQDFSILSSVAQTINVPVGALLDGLEQQEASRLAV